MFALVLFLAVPALVLAQPDAGQPPDELGKHIGAVIDAVRSGSANMLLVDLFKAPWLGSVFKKVPKRWRIAIPIILSGIAGVLSNILGGIPWQEAVVVGLFAGPTAVFAHEAVVEAILGHFQILDSGRSTQVEEVLACATIACAVTLPLSEMREFMLDNNALS